MNQRQKRRERERRRTQRIAHDKHINSKESSPYFIAVDFGTGGDFPITSVWQQITTASGNTLLNVDYYENTILPPDILDMPPQAEQEPAESYGRSEIEASIGAIIFVERLRKSLGLPEHLSGLFCLPSELIGSSYAPPLSERTPEQSLAQKQERSPDRVMTDLEFRRVEQRPERLIEAKKDQSSPNGRENHS